MKQPVYVEGDLFANLKGCMETTLVMLPHVCNDRGAWGKGFVVPLGEAFPESRKAYIDWHRGVTHPSHIQRGQFGLGKTQFVNARDYPRLIVCNMVAQTGTGGKRPLRYNALVNCMDEVAEMAKTFGSHAAIHCPLFGSDLAGGDWNFIERLIEDCWLRPGIPVTVHYLPGRVPDNFTIPAE